MPLAYYACGKLAILYVMGKYIRYGECNRCGQCCGAPGGPDRRAPFSVNWPRSLQSWKYENIVKQCPLLPLLGLSEIRKNRWGISKNIGKHIVSGKEFYWVWIEGLGYQRDISSEHDGSKYAPECPFLEDDPGDETRPCGLIGTQNEDAFNEWCKPEPFSPRSKRQVDEWMWRHPKCSYEWIHEE